MMGSFDAGYGTWYLEDLVGKKKAKEMWYLNPRLSAREALEIGLINKVVPDDQLRAETRKMALEVSERGAFALAAIKERSRAPWRRRWTRPRFARFVIAPVSRHRRARGAGESVR